MEIRTLVVGQLQTNCYLLDDEKNGKAVIIDPGDDADYIQRVIADNHLSPRKIIATHGHFDHLLAVAELAYAYHLPFLMHQADEFLLDRMQTSTKIYTGLDSGPPPEIDVYLEEKNSLRIANCELRIIHVPGHTPGSISLYCEKRKIIFVGDLVFAFGEVGRTDYKYSSRLALTHSINEILKLPGETKVYPGHGPPTTINKIKDKLKKNLF